MGIIRVWKNLIRQMILFTIVFPYSPQNININFPCFSLYYPIFFHVLPFIFGFPNKKSPWESPQPSSTNVDDPKDTKNAFQGAPALSILAARRMYEQFLLRLLFCLVGFSWQKIEKHWLVFCSRVIMVGWWKLATNVRTMMIRKHWEKWVYKTKQIAFANVLLRGFLCGKKTTSCKCMPWLLSYLTLVSVSNGQTEFLCCYLARYCAWNVVILTEYQGGLVESGWRVGTLIQDVFFCAWHSWLGWIVQQPFLQHSRVCRYFMHDLGQVESKSIIASRCTNKSSVVPGVNPGVTMSGTHLKNTGSYWYSSLSRWWLQWLFMKKPEKKSLFDKYTYYVCIYIFMYICIHIYLSIYLSIYIIYVYTYFRWVHTPHG